MTVGRVVRINQFHCQCIFLCSRTDETELVNKQEIGSEKISLLAKC